MPPTFESQGEYFATVYNEAEDTVFLKVNDYEVNYREYAVIKARFETNLANQKVMDANKVPDDEWSPPEGLSIMIRSGRYPSSCLTTTSKRWARLWISMVPTRARWAR